MAATHVQTVFADAAASPVAVTLTLTAGHAIIVSVGTDNSTPTQTTGPTLTQNSTIAGSGLSQFQYSNLSVPGGSTTITFTNSAGSLNLFVTEVSGLATSAAFDVSAGTTYNISTTQATGTTATTTQANEFVLALFDLNGSGSTAFTSISNGFTSAITPETNTMGAGRSRRGYAAYKVVSATGTQTTTLTCDNCAAESLIVTFKAAALGGAWWGGALAELRNRRVKDA